MNVDYKFQKLFNFQSIRQKKVQKNKTKKE